jgi:hypothetical protein
MSYFDSASLVMIPSGYKDQKVYSVKPIDGSGDLTFTRSNDTATRVASNGLIEKVRTNLQTYSQDFSNAVWVKSAGATLTHSQTDPNGGTTASRLQMPSGTSNYFAASAISGLTNGGQYTHSVYMKSNTGSTQSVRILDGVRGAAGGTLLASVTTSWQRFEVVITTASTSAGLQIDNVAGTYNNDIIIAFAQTEVSDFGATPYIATTSAAVSVGPVANLPRLDYSGGATCPKLLLEGQRTNLPNGRNFARVLFGNGSFPDNQSAYFNLLTGATSATASITASMVSYGNGWYRCIATMTSDANATDAAYFGPARNMTDGYTSYAGNASLGIYAFGAQQEAGAYATSYIPTLGAAVTRGADSAYKTGISSLFGTNQGTFLMDFVYSDKSIAYGQFLFDVTDSTNYYRLLMYSEGGGTTYDEYSIYDSDSGVVATYNLYQNTRYKIGVKYNSTAIYWYINGSLVATGGAFGYQMEQIYLAQRYSLAENVAINLNQTLVFPTALTNAQLAELTTI